MLIRSTESNNGIYRLLEQYHALRMDKATVLFRRHDSFADYRNLETLSHLKVTPTQTGEEVIVAALTMIDDGKSWHCPVRGGQVQDGESR